MMLLTTTSPLPSESLFLDLLRHVAQALSLR
ncbi:hypothetical protein X760_18310 [Mesorhizobium sp. LSHC422A00]|nr:hypothetical protein X762_31505 [Mesorhizobium sp. LSHC426A00]ESX60171.1 hypothetical protein X760_18310 [Mesorhizobium sp. LSHC422A00]